MIQLYDTHAHYTDPEFDGDRDAILQGMEEKGLVRINCIGTDPDTSEQAVKLAETYPILRATVGTWPGYTRDMTEADLERYRELAGSPQVVAVGEIGLDYHYEDTPREIQKIWFERQLGLAEELGLPVVVHEREAHGDGMEIVRRWASRVRGVFHCFSGSAEMARQLVDLGWYISFTGVLTFKNARRAIEAAAAVPLDRIMIETDSPYMAPVPYRGLRNDSGYVGLVAEKLAEIKGLSLEEIAAATTENGFRFFDRGKRGT